MIGLEFPIAMLLVSGQNMSLILGIFDGTHDACLIEDGALSPHVTKNRTERKDRRVSNQSVN